MDKPLALILRPTSLSDVVGQTHLIGKDKIISNMVKNKKLFSIILYGNPGTGKTSIANAIVNDLKCHARFLNATLNNKQDLLSVIEEAKMLDGIVLVMDEIHRMNKDKQDILLPCLENGLITLIGLTTSNPYHKINPAIRSRCEIFKLEPLTSKDIADGLNKAIKKDILKDIKIDKKTIKYISEIAKGDLRFALNLLEVSYYFNKDHIVSDEIIKSINNKPNLFFDKNESSYYDTLSGLQKSIRGSDVDAALHYAAKMLLAEDLEGLCRRLSVIAYEDIGLANPNIGPRLEASINAAERVGLPEARIVMSNIIIEMALSPKSNTANSAMEKAINDLETKNIGDIPSYLKSPYIGYKYPHIYKNSIINQTYLPKGLENAKYYLPKDSSKYEINLKNTKEKIEKFKASLKD